MVVEDKHPPNRAKDKKTCTPPYIDCPAGGYVAHAKKAWIDDLPWFYDEGKPPKDSPIQKVANPNPYNPKGFIYKFVDEPDDPGETSTLVFYLWLVALDKDNKFVSFATPGITWTWEGIIQGGKEESRIKNVKYIDKTPDVLGDKIKYYGPDILDQGGFPKK